MCLLERLDAIQDPHVIVLGGYIILQLSAGLPTTQFGVLVLAGVRPVRHELAIYYADSLVESHTDVTIFYVRPVLHRPLANLASEPVELLNTAVILFLGSVEVPVQFVIA